MTGSDAPRSPAAFLQDGGELGRRIAALDWSATSVGPIERWPAAMKTMLAFVLRSPLPIVTLWGDKGVMIYNDGYRAFAGARHPGILGRDVLEGWHEVADFNANVMQRVYREGDTLTYRDQDLTLVRDGTPRTLWADLEYSPALDETGVRIGVVAVVIETTQKVLAEREAQDERRRLMQMSEHSPSFMALLEGPSHRFAMVNPAYRRLVGGRDVIGQTVAEALPEAVDQGFLRLLDQVYRSGEAVTMTGALFALQPGEGGKLDERYVDFVYQPIPGLDGAVSGIFVSGVDVTERTKAQAAILASETQFRTFAQAMPAHVWTSRPDGKLDWFNDRVFAYADATHDELQGDGWAAIVHPDDVALAAERWGHSLATGATYEAEFRLRRADGAFFWHLVRAVPIRDDDDRILRWIGTNTEIHEQKLSQAESAADRDRLWMLSPLLQVVTDDGGLIVDVNPAWTEMLGWGHDETVGRRSTDFMIDDTPHWAERVAELRAGLPLADYQTTVATRGGGHRLIRWTTFPDNGRFYGFGRDVTVETAAAATLAETEAALRQAQKMEAVGQLTGGIAHDFNNLLQGISGSLEIVQRRVAQGRTADLDRFITGASTAANRAAALTHRLLAFSRRQPLAPKPVRGNALVASMEDLLRRTIGERIDFELVLAGGLWVTKCDPNQLESAILNLVINARDAMPDGGKLTIETCNAHLDSAYVASQRGVSPGQYICICVTDTGMGMDADTVARAFEPFFTTKPIGQGTGLGLSMIYGFAQQSEGYAKIYSEPGKGTTMRLYLPRFRGEADEEEAAPELREEHRTKHDDVVLVVEDEQIVRGLILEELSELGYVALEAVDGPKGLEVLQSKRRIDLLITDIGLPGLNGRQVADAARAIRPELKILFMTGYAENAALASGFLEPGMEMITKPFAMEALATRIRAMIEGKSG